MRNALAWVLMLGGCLLAGCGGSGKSAISGLIEYDGKPLAKGLIRFVPADGVGPTAEAMIDAGRYTVEVANGKKKVSIAGMEEIGFTLPGGPSGPKVPEYKEVVPAKYNTATTLTYEVTGPTTDADFNLEK